MATPQYSPEIQAVIDAWRPYINSIKDWETLVFGVDPKDTNCGPVYELSNPFDRPNESFAVADMRGVEHALPHYHAGGEVEIYFVLAGLGRVVVDNEVIVVGKGSMVVTPSGIAHYALPDPEQGLVLAVVNTPPFNPADDIEITETSIEHGYDHALFQQLTQR